jgi:hypothetical protein
VQIRRKKWKAESKGKVNQQEGGCACAPALLEAIFVAALASDGRGKTYDY